MQDLEDKLKEATAFADTRFKVIVTDGVFSMDGELAKLKEIVDLAAKYDALVFVDECHATGILGAHGRGTAEHLGIPEDRIDFTNSTLGKGRSSTVSRSVLTKCLVGSAWRGQWRLHCSPRSSLYHLVEK